MASLYPGITDTAASIFVGSDRAASGLAADISDSDTTIEILDGSDFPTTGGVVLVDEELIVYTGRTGNFLTGAIRGEGNTFPNSHTTTDAGGDSTFVKLVFSAKYFNDLRAGLIAVQDELGSDPAGIFATVADRLDSIEAGVGITLQEVTDSGSSTTNGITINAAVGEVGLIVNSPTTGEDGIHVIQASSSHSARIKIENDVTDSMTLIMGRNAGPVGYINLTGNHPFRIDNNNATKRLLHIDADGDVGIGNNGAPAYRLDIKGGDIAIENEETIIFNTNDGADIHIRAGDVAGDDRLFISVEGVDTARFDNGGVDVFTQFAVVGDPALSAPVLTLNSSTNMDSTNGTSTLRLENDIGSSFDIIAQRSGSGTGLVFANLTQAGGSLRVQDAALATIMHMLEDGHEVGINQSAVIGQQLGITGGRTLFFSDSDQGGLVHHHFQTTDSGTDFVIENTTDTNVELEFRVDSGSSANWQFLFQTSGAFRIIDQLGTGDKSRMRFSSEGEANGARIQVGQAGVVIPFRFDTATTVERDALSPLTADAIYNTTTGRLEVYDGSGWDFVSSETLQTVTDAGATTTNPIGLPAGAVGAPSLFFTTDTTTGIYSGGADILKLATTGADRLSLTSGSATWSVQQRWIDGSAAAPAQVYGNDPDTGIYRPSDDHIGFSTGGTSRVVIDDVGFVGIGTETPNAPLVVERDETTGSAISARFNNLGGDSQVMIRSGTDSNHSALIFQAGIANKNRFSWWLDSADDFAIKLGKDSEFRTAENQVMEIDQSGNVLINQGDLDVVGNINIVSTSAAFAYFIDDLQVLTSRMTGWTAPTGTDSRATFDADSTSVTELAQRLKALIDDLTAHGIIGS